MMKVLEHDVKRGLGEIDGIRGLMVDLGAGLRREEFGEEVNGLRGSVIPIVWWGLVGELEELRGLAGDDGGCGFLGRLEGWKEGLERQMECLEGLLEGWYKVSVVGGGEYVYEDEEGGANGETKYCALLPRIPGLLWGMGDWRAEYEVWDRLLEGWVQEVGEWAGRRGEFAKGLERGVWGVLERLKEGEGDGEL